MPELVQREAAPRSGAFARPAAVEIDGFGGGPAVVDADRDRLIRRELRRQIVRMERELGELLSAAFPRRGMHWEIAAAGGPRILGIAELEQVRDALALQVGAAHGQLNARLEIEERNRDLLEEMVRAPQRYRWLRVSNQDIGEPGCKHWHAKPKLGPIGMLMGWWRVKISSGCP
ncbi:MAG: hypothetical protein QOJ38_1137 [Solirubrobacterales bacterium]|nr:hypothetical protein [Solirubrobacterales bacterium]